MTLTSLWLTLRSLLIRGTVVGVDDSGPAQLVTADLLAGEQRVCDAMGVYGFTSAPPPGADVLTASPDGHGGDLIVIATRYSPARPTGLRAGAATMYSSGRARVTVDGDAVRLEGDIELAGNVRVSGTVRIRGGSRPVAGRGDSVDVRSGRVLTGSDSLLVP